MKFRTLRWFCSKLVMALLVSTALCAPFVRAAALPEDVFPELRQVLQSALAQSPRMIAVNLDRLSAEHQTLVSSARLYPTIGAGLTYNQQLEDRGGEWNPGERLIYDVSASYALFNWGQVRATAEMGRIGAAIAARNVTEAYRLLALQTRSSFLDLIVAKAALHAADFSVQLQSAEVDLARSRADAGEVAPNVVQGAQYTLDERTLGAERARLNFEISLRRFCRLTGVDSFNADSVPNELPPVERTEQNQLEPFWANYVDREGWQEVASYDRRELEIQQQRLRERILRVNQRPRIDLRAGFSQDELAFGTDITIRSRLAAAFVGVSVGWNIFDGFATRGQLRSAQTYLQQLENGLTEMEKDLKEAPASALKDCELALRSLDLAEFRFQSARNGLNIARENFELGLTSQSAVNQALAADYAAQPSIFSARAAYMNAIATFLSSVNADPVVGSSVNPPAGS